MTDHLDVVFLDVGGPIYADDTYYRSLLAAIREFDPSVTEEAYREVYDACRRDQNGSFRTRLTRTLLGPEVSVEDVAARAERHWLYPPEALLPDVIPALEALSGRYRLGVLANQTERVREVMRRDGIDRFFELWNVSAELGVEKPDLRIFEHALAGAGVQPARTAMVGDRLDNDVRPARAAGMRAIWLLRGEAPDDPTPEQLAEPDASIRSMADLPKALERFRETAPEQRA